MEQETTYEKTNDGQLKEIQPEIPAVRPSETFSPDVIDEMVRQWAVTVEEAQRNYALWKKRQDKAIELEVSRGEGVENGGTE